MGKIGFSDSDLNCRQKIRCLKIVRQPQEHFPAGEPDFICWYMANMKILGSVWSYQQKNDEFWIRLNFFKWQTSQVSFDFYCTCYLFQWNETASWTYFEEMLLKLQHVSLFMSKEGLNIWHFCGNVV
jgi:hypothetical protein